MRRLRHALAAAVLLLAAAAPAAAQPAPASPAQLRAAERVLVAMRARENLDRMREPMRAQFAAQFGGDSAIIAVMEEEMDRMLDWDELRPLYLRIYSETFTVEDLEAMAAFYESPAGQRIVDRMPELTTRLMAITNERVQERIPEMVNRLLRASSPRTPAGGARKP